MSCLRHINQCFVILLVIILANAQSDLPENEATTISNLADTADTATEAAVSELAGDMKRNERSFFGDLWGDLFDDCDCNNCACNPASIQNNIQPNYNYDNVRDNSLHGVPVFRPFKPWKALKKLNLFDKKCGGNCGGNHQVHYHHGYNGNGYNHNGYNNNDAYNNNPNPTPQSYEQPKYEEAAPVYEKPKYEEPVKVYEQPKYEEPATFHEEPKYEDAPPAYEKPTTIYKKPIYEAQEKTYDCQSNNCPPQPQLVYQPIIYLGPAQAHVNEASSEEEQEAKYEAEQKYEEPAKHEEQNNYEETYESHSSYEEKKETEKHSSEEEKEYKKEEHKPHAVVPVAPVYLPCTHGCGTASAYAFPPINYAAPQSLPLHQVINYNGLVPNHVPITPNYGGDYYPYGYPMYPPAPYSSGCGCAQQTYGPVYPPASIHSVTHHGANHYGSQQHGSQNHGSNQHGSYHHGSNHHGSHHQYTSAHQLHQFPVVTPHDPLYRVCPELFAAYNNHVAHLTSTNSLQE